MKKKNPLVSIMIPNRNHAQFLGACIESALNQTYDNIEIVVLDNCSDDNSMEVASRYIDRGVTLCRNPHNILNNSYKVLACLTEGKYMTLLCADDLIQPEFIESCVDIMENNPEVGYVHSERDYIDGHGNITELDPFYNCSFVAPGESTLPIYLLTDVAQPAQCLIRRSTFTSVLGYNTEFDHTNADKEMWFKLSLVSNYAYLRRKFVLIRIHEARESTVGFRNFFHPLAMYLSIDSQVKRGKLEGHQTVVERLPAAYEKLAQESLLIADACLRDNDRGLAKKYLLFAQILSDDIVHSDTFHKVQILCNATDDELSQKLRATATDSVFVRRKRNYPPPEGYTLIEEGDFQ